MKEPKVHVGILSGQKIEFTLLNTYRMNGEEVSGKQTALFDDGKSFGETIIMKNYCLNLCTRLQTLSNCRMSPSVLIFTGNEKKTNVSREP